MEDVCFSGAALAVVSGMFTILTGTISYLFKLILSGKDGYIKILEARVLRLEEVGEEAVAQAEKSTRLVKRTVRA
jgi:hypothetical protein